LSGSGGKPGYTTKDGEEVAGVRLAVLYEDGSYEEINNLGFIENKFKRTDQHPDYLLTAKFPVEDE